MSQERVGIIVEVTGGNEALSLMRQLDSTIKSLNGKKIKFDFGGKEVQGLVSATQQTQKLGNEMVQTTAKGKTMAQMMRTTFNRISSSTMHVGQQMQVLGKTMTQISSPFRSFMRSTVWAAGFKALDTAMSGFSGAFERYDTMQNYAKSLNALGLDADKTFKVFANQKEAMTAIDNLNESVQGLPTGLDEIVAAQKIYAGATGEMVKSTKTAIAANNTFLASGTNAREQRFIQRYLASLASGAELTTTQWQSMSRIAPLAMRAVAEKLDYAGDKYQDFIKDVSNGTIAGQEFLDTFIEVGTNGKVQQAANVMKTTWAGLAANVQNATRRMGEGILKALDDAFVSLNGRNFVQNLLGFDAEGNEVGGGIKHWINDISQSVQDWIRANPDKILDFFESLKSIDIKGFLKGAAEGVREMVNLYKGMIDLFSGMGMENVGKWMVRFSWMGRGLNIAGGFLKGSRGILATLGTILAMPIMRRRTGMGGGLFARLLNAIGTKKDAETLSQTVRTFPTFKQSMQGLVSSISGALKVFAPIALAAGTGFVAFRSFKTMLKDFNAIIQEINTLKAQDIDSAMAAITAMGTFFGGFAVLAGSLGTAMTGITSLSSLLATPAIKGGLLLAGITTFASGVLALDMGLVKSAFDSFKGITQSLKTGMEELASLKTIKVDTNALDTALSTMGKIYDAIAGSNEFIGGGEGSTASTKVKVAKKAKQIVENISGVIKDINNSIKDLNNLPDTTNIEGAVGKVKDTLTALKNVYEEALLDLDMKSGVQTSEREGTIVSNIASLISTIKTSVADLKEMESVEVELDAAKENITSIGQKMGEIFTAMNEAFGQVFVTDYSSDFTQTSNEGVTNKQVKKAGNLQSLFEAFSSTIGYIRQAYQTLMGGEGDVSFDLDAFSETMNKLTGDGGIIPQMKQMYDTLTGEDTGFAGDVDIETPMQAFANAIGSIKTAVQTLQEIGGIEFEGDGGIGSVIASINDMVSQLGATFNADAITALTEQVNSFITSVNNLITQIQTMQGMSADNPIELSITFTHTITGADEVVSAIQKADNAIKAAVNAIQTSYTKTITVTLSPRVNRLPMPSTTYFPHTGGYIGRNGLQYRAGGGSIFKRRGTDIVPAMLTPGEYVQNKKAVDFFGIDFMRRVNNLDYKGALASLLGKAGAMAKGSTVINNYDNRSVTINGADVSNAGYTFKRASRFVGVM